MRKLSQKRAKKIEMIDYKLDHLCLNDDLTAHLIAYVLSAMPDKVVDYVVDNVIFLTFKPEDKGQTYNIAEMANEWNKKYIIILGADYYNQSEKEQCFTIAHEIGHAYYGHKNIPSGLKGEKQADIFANKYGFPGSAYKFYKEQQKLREV